MANSLRKAAPADLPAIQGIVAGAQAFLRSMGVDQWQDGYPDQDVMLADMRDGNGYVLEDGSGAILGIATIIFGDEPAYARIYDGAWETPEPYACIHRAAVRADQRGTGTAVAMMAAAERLVVERGFPGIRIDTHRDNLPMLTMLAKCGFKRCGVIYLEDGAEAGAERIALEKRL